MIVIGDRVAYSAKFLRSIACFTGDLPQIRGRVTAIKDYGSITVATIAWDGELADIPIHANVNNLAKVGSVAMVSS